MAVLLFAACGREEISFGTSGTDGNSIILDVSAGRVPLGRAVELTATGVELAVDHIDVLILNEDGSWKYNERLTNCTDGEGQLMLSAKREEFDEGKKYWVYLIANSSHTKETFDNMTLDGLQKLTETTTDVHMTGLKGSEVALPQSFLMDGVAYKGETEPDTEEAVVLNEKSGQDTRLKATLRRAAAKIVVTMNKGEQVNFVNSSDIAKDAGYYLRNMPYTTAVWPGITHEAELQTSEKNAAEYYAWSAEKIVVTAYTYAHAWANQSALEKEVRLIVNIPLEYNDAYDPQNPDATPNWKVSGDNYYQIPVCADKRLDRNKCYAVEVTVNARGGTQPSEPIVLEDVAYTVADWESSTINIGGEVEEFVYLTVNEKEMAMYNMEDDNTTLRFASSSRVSVDIDSVYYFDKFGQKQVTTNRNAITQMGIRVEPDEELNGHIKIHSQMPTNNTIRYIVLEVSNDDGATPKSVTVAQYPLEYITNIQGLYSYRSDFGGTTYDNPIGNPKRVSAYRYNAKDDSWQYSATGVGSNYIFTSKVAQEITSGTNRGKSKIDYYYFKNSNSTSFSTQEIWGTQNPGNARMYHVRITASSGNYTIGRPRITGGKTDSGEDNAKLVSPSFMIASQLGAVYSISSVEMAESHCEQYVEVYKDKNGNKIHLNDWRLPTEAELKIIMEFQYKQNAAMDEVLAWKSYWSASGLVINEDANSTDTRAIRCIRDAYDTEL
ncbi:MAG: hypothetical protein KH111_07010 [Bacteroidales bacterium]|nr:hypothetical protein [Bacteroidales bacterium]